MHERGGRCASARNGGRSREAVCAPRSRKDTSCAPCYPLTPMPTTRPTVYLFDIDGTLISTGGAGRKAMEGAFRDVHGASGPAAVAFSFAGMTDRAIVRNGLSALEHHAPDAAALDHVLDRYL